MLCHLTPHRLLPLYLYLTSPHLPYLTYLTLPHRPYHVSTTISSASTTIPHHNRHHLNIITPHHTLPSQLPRWIKSSSNKVHLLSSLSTWLGTDNRYIPLLSTQQHHLISSINNITSSLLSTTHHLLDTALPRHLFEQLLHLSSTSYHQHHLFHYQHHLHDITTSTSSTYISDFGWRPVGGSMR